MVSIEHVHRTHLASSDRPVSRPALTLFLVALLIPLSLHLGPMRLTPYRIMLLGLVVPLGIRVLSGGAGRVTPVDILMVLYGLWLFVALAVTHGTAQIAYAGITAVELLGGYFVGRCFVRGPEDYRWLFRALFVALLVLLPFSVIETITGNLVIPDLLRPLGDTPSRSWSAYGRMGLERVYSVFDHPILYGLFCSMMLANFAFIARTAKARVLMMAVSLISAGLSLSAGPLLACAVQFAMLAWYWVMKGRWNILIAFIGMLYLLFMVAAERSLASFVIEYLTFNSNTGWIRLAVFDYGWRTVVENPVFGIGLNNWERPSWLTSSIDNFWLVNAVRYGLPGAGLAIAFFLSHILYTAFVRLTTPEWIALRIGHLVVLVGTCLTLYTVHIWGTVSVFVMFYIGAGAWIYTRPETGDAAPDEDVTAADGPTRQTAPYTRFAPHHVRGPLEEGKKQR